MSESTMDEAVRVSGALREYLGQQECLGRRPGNADHLSVMGPRADYNLTAIWRAAQSDPGCPSTPGQIRYLSPRRFLNRQMDRVKAIDRDDDGNLYADEAAAFRYCTFLDDRVMEATVQFSIARRKRAVARDPIGAAVGAARGGPFAMMFIRQDARQFGWRDDDEFDSAVMRRAIGMAATMDVYEAESLVADVRRAIEDGPRTGRGV